MEMKDRIATLLGVTAVGGVQRIGDHETEIDNELLDRIVTMAEGAIAAQLGAVNTAKALDAAMKETRAVTAERDLERARGLHDGLALKSKKMDAAKALIDDVATVCNSLAARNDETSEATRKQLNDLAERARAFEWVSPTKEAAVEAMRIAREEHPEALPLAGLEQLARATAMPSVDINAAWNKAVEKFHEDGHNTAPREDGQQWTHVVLPEAVRKVTPARRPYRDQYKHEKCGKVTTMGSAIAETYQRKPDAYSSTWCVHCRGYFPVGADGEFVWLDNGSKVGT